MVVLESFCFVFFFLFFGGVDVYMLQSVKFIQEVIIQFENVSFLVLLI